ncbi:hypothetical protein BH11PSE2_BH11PSE2_06930 [soil metagenome]
MNSLAPMHWVVILLIAAMLFLARVVLSEDD